MLSDKHGDVCLHGEIGGKIAYGRSSYNGMGDIGYLSRCSVDNSGMNLRGKMGHALNTEEC